MNARALTCLVTAGLLFGLVAQAHAQRPSEEVEYVPANELPSGVEVHERVGDKVALDTPMLDQDGHPRTLRELLTDRPVLLTFNYSSCPGLCSVHLNRLVESLASADLAPGGTYRLVTVVLAPEEGAVRTARTRRQYLDKLASAGAAAVTSDGWTFLIARPGDDDRGIRGLADSVGFGYKKVDGQYAHPATVIALATNGTITRYVHGLELTGADLATTVIKAGLAEPGTAVGYVLSCFHLAPRSHNALVARELLRIVAFSFAAVLLGIGVFVFTRRHRSLSSTGSGVMPS